MKTILVIEDQEHIRENLMWLLEAEGYNVLTAPNGRIGLATALEHLPDLVICDVMMPEMTGHEVIAGLRANAATKSTPFVFLTAKAEKADLREGMTLGADDYLTKPFTADEVLTAIDTRLQKQAENEEEVRSRIDELRYSISNALPHELRTPLAAIMGIAQIMHDDYDEMEADVAKGMLKDLYEAGHRLNHTIEQYTYYTRLELLQHDPESQREFRTVDADDFAPDIELTAYAHAERHHRTTDLQVEVEAAPLAVNGDALRRIVGAVADNAFKFSEAGEAVTVRGTSTPNGYVIELSDQGRGMEAVQIQRIGAFVQFDRATHEQQGQGLGLAIVRRLVAFYDGAIAFESAPNAGTSVRITLPFQYQHLRRAA
ncbi:MAG: response regulator [Bacteroidota bacterium]